MDAVVLERGGDELVGAGLDEADSGFEHVAVQPAATVQDMAPPDTAYTAEIRLAATSKELLHYQRHECGYGMKWVIAGVQRLFADCVRRS